MRLFLRTHFGVQCVIGVTPGYVSLHPGLPRLGPFRALAARGFRDTLGSRTLNGLGRGHFVSVTGIGGSANVGTRICSILGRRNYTKSREWRPEG